MIGGVAVDVAGMSAAAFEDERAATFVCVAGAVPGRVVVVCRMSAEMSEPALSSLASRIVANDLPAVKW